MSSVVAKPLPDGRLGVRVDPDATLEVPVYVTTPPDATPGGVDADHLHRDRRQDGRAQRRGRPFLRSVIVARMSASACEQGLQGAGAAHVCAIARREQRVWKLTGRHVLAWLGAFFSVMFAANVALIYFALHTLHGQEIENPYDASQAFNQRIADARAQDERGWKADVMTRAEGSGERVMVEFRDRAARRFPTSTVRARFEHPFDAAQDRQRARLRRRQLRRGREPDRAGTLDPGDRGEPRRRRRLFRSENKIGGCGHGPD